MRVRFVTAPVGASRFGIKKSRELEIFFPLFLFIWVHTFHNTHIEKRERENAGDYSKTQTHEIERESVCETRRFYYLVQSFSASLLFVQKKRRGRRV